MSGSKRKGSIFAKPAEFTTSRPDWWQARTAEDVLPEVVDPHGFGKTFADACGALYLTQGDAAGSRFSARMLPWQRRYFELLGSGVNAEGSRFLRDSLLVVGKGSGKSNMLIAALLAHCVTSHARGQNARTDACLVAADMRTSLLLYETLTAAIKCDKHLAKLFKFSARETSATFEPSGMVIRTLPVSLKAAVGRRPSMLIFDELHAAAMRPEFEATLDQLRRGASNAENALTLFATTASPTLAVGSYANLLSYGEKVQSGEILDNTFLPAIFKLPIKHFPNEDFLSDRKWFHFGMPSLANEEGLGTQTVEALEREITRAKSMGGKELGFLLSQRFNLDSEDRTSAESLEILRYWDAIPASLTAPKLTGDVAIAVDVGGMDDCQAVAVCWSDADVFRGFAFFGQQFITESGLAKQPPATRSVFDKAIEEGHLQVGQTPADIDKLMADYINLVKNMCWATPIFGGDSHGRAGVSGFLVNETDLDWSESPQNWKLRATFEQLESLPESGMISLEKSALLRYNFRNLRVDKESSGKVFSKADATGVGAMKIDGAMALMSALYLMNELQSGRKKFDVRAFIV